ncbi:lipase family protein [Spongisporangium articulatum]|uniref:Lipase family protein n=1 Tax=Spongisporangium articulatum TaxID=3362603 RepID=A0ABW8AKD9_9ACTN
MLLVGFQPGNAAGAAAAPPVGPAGTAFYDPPDRSPAGRPGDVIRYRRVAALPGTRAWRILYVSRSALDRPIAVSGLVIVPTRRMDGPRPIVGYGHGTAGLADSCAGSLSPLSVAGQVVGALVRGWAVAFTDYEGLGTPGLHTYQVGRSEGRSVLDAVRAAQRLPAAGLGSSNPVGLWGYSQGGGAVAWAAELQPAYAPELNLVGVAAGGTPADLRAVADKLKDTLIGPIPLAMTALGFDAAYPDFHLDELLSDRGREVLGKVKVDCMAAIAARLAGRSLAGLTRRDPLQDEVFLRRLDENRLGQHPPNVPVLLVHGRSDEASPIGQAHQLAKEYCAAGVDVTWKTFWGDHLVAGVTSQPTVLRFLADRFEGRPVTTTC